MLNHFLSAMHILLADSAASSSRFSNLVGPIVDLLNSMLGPLLAIVSALGSIYCVILGVKFAKAEEPQDREKAKGALKNAIIGFVLIFVLILALKLLMPTMISWVNSSAKTTVITAASAASTSAGS